MNADLKLPGSHSLATFDRPAASAPIKAAGHPSADDRLIWQLRNAAQHLRETVPDDYPAYQAIAEHLEAAAERLTALTRPLEEGEEERAFKVFIRRLGELSGVDEEAALADIPTEDLAHFKEAFATALRSTPPQAEETLRAALERMVAEERERGRFSLPSFDADEYPHVRQALEALGRQS